MISRSDDRQQVFCNGSVAILPPIDLRERLRVQRLLLRGSDGSPIANARVTFRHADEKRTGERHLLTGPRGELNAWSAVDIGAFELETQGFRPVRITWSSEPQELQLQAN